jgi:hypothetical protein
VECILVCTVGDGGIRGKARLEESRQQQATAATANRVPIRLCVRVAMVIVEYAFELQ